MVFKEDRALSSAGMEPSSWLFSRSLHMSPWGTVRRVMANNIRKSDMPALIP